MSVPLLTFAAIVLEVQSPTTMLPLATMPSIDLESFAACSLAAGYAMVPFVPPIRHIYSPSFIAITMGYSALSLALCYTVADIFRLRRGTWLFLLFGQTALCAWMLHTNPLYHGLATVAGHLVAGVPRLIGTSSLQGFLKVAVVSAMTVWILVLWRRLKQKGAK